MHKLFIELANVLHDKPVDKLKAYTVQNCNIQVKKNEDSSLAVTIDSPLNDSTSTLSYIINIIHNPKTLKTEITATNKIEYIQEKITEFYNIADLAGLPHYVFDTIDSALDEWEKVPDV